MFQTFIYQPILYTLQFIYQNLSGQDLGVAVILLTLLIRVVLYPLFWKSSKDQVIMKKIQPEITEIQKDKKSSAQDKGERLMKVYKENKLNPFSSIIILIVQLPIFFALFKIFSQEISGGTFDNTSLLGLIDLRENGGILALVAAALQYIQVKLSMHKPAEGAVQGKFDPQKFLLYAAPILTIVVLWNLPKALALYWAAMTVFTLLQQWYMERKMKKNGSNNNK